MLNDPTLRQQICEKACERFGYTHDAVSVRMYVGKFSSGHEEDIRYHVSKLQPSVEIIGLNQIVAALIRLSGKKTYTNDPVVMTVKALAAAGRLANVTEAQF